MVHFNEYTKYLRPNDCRTPHLNKYWYRGRYSDPAIINGGHWLDVTVPESVHYQLLLRDFPFFQITTCFFYRFTGTDSSSQRNGFTADFYDFGQNWFVGDFYRGESWTKWEMSDNGSPQCLYLESKLASSDSHWNDLHFDFFDRDDHVKPLAADSRKTNAGVGVTFRLSLQFSWFSGRTLDFIGLDSKDFL